MVVQCETSSSILFVGSEADHTKGELLTPRTAERCPQLQAHVQSMSWGHGAMGSGRGILSKYIDRVDLDADQRDIGVMLA